MNTTANATPAPCLYLNATGSDTSFAHPAIVAAIANGGIFSEDFADIFTLTKLPEGGNCAWRLDFA